MNLRDVQTMIKEEIIYLKDVQTMIERKLIKT